MFLVVLTWGVLVYYSHRFMGATAWTPYMEAVAVTYCMAGKAGYVHMHNMEHVDATYLAILSLNLTPCHRQDTLWGNTGDDIIYGGLGRDILYGGSGEDAMFGGNGRDTLYGGFGSDSMWGDKAGDLLYGEGQADHLYGALGPDTLFGGNHLDVLRGGLGLDLLVAGGGGINGGAGMQVNNCEDVISSIACWECTCMNLLNLAGAGATFLDSGPKGQLVGSDRIYSCGSISVEDYEVTYIEHPSDILNEAADDAMCLL